MLTPLLLITILLLAIFWWKSIEQAPFPTDNKSYPFIIKPGQGAAPIGRALENTGFIKSELAFRMYVQIKGISSKIQAGDYRLQKNNSLSQLISELTQGPIAIWITIPEGMRREEIAQKISGELNLTDKEKQEFIKNFLELSETKEGYLFPDTYLFLKNTTPKTIVEKMTENFEKKVNDDILTAAQKQGLNLLELLTLASIIERETITDEERSIVAGILLKRLKIGMPLQTDATLQYAAATNHCSLTTIDCQWWKQITANDKAINSPYNTYLNRGLPPTPISNPGLSSIKAAAKAESSPYLFYLHDNEGNIHYAKTIEEHGQNINKYLR